ncbi:MAG TPA: class I SAM-dependent methyltransferase [Methanospirillum sp.]|nr:class I SAM-dependent methyltransferase [Methanospirillum sp.]
MTRNHACRNFQECASTWVTEEKARAFWRAACKNQERYTPIVEMIAAAHPRCVLDIGGGPGSLALPLAGRGIRITVVEPASGMITLLKENSVTRKLSGIHPIHKRWEDIEIQDLDMPYDVVVACFSLGMPDIVGAIQKMEHVCSGKIFLIWFAGTTPWEDIVQNLWPVYHQRPYEPGPKSDILFQVLYQMGIYPDVTVRKEQYIEEQTRISDLVDDYAERLCVPEGADRQPIGEYFKTLNICTDGVFRFPGELTTMTFSWKSRG